MRPRDTPAFSAAMIPPQGNEAGGPTETQMAGRCLWTVEEYSTVGLLAPPQRDQRNELFTKAF
jgi:hypothetical protein